MPVTSSIEVRGLVGPVADETIVAILNSEPSFEELALAASYVRGEGSELDHPLTGKVAQLYDILSTDALYENNEI